MAVQFVLSLPRLALVSLALALVVLTMGACAVIETRKPDGTVETRYGITPIVIAPAPEDGDVQTIEGVGAGVSVGPHGAHIAVGYHYSRTVWMTECGLALDLKTDRPDLIPRYIAEPCKEPNP